MLGVLLVASGCAAADEPDATSSASSEQPDTTTSDSGAPTSSPGETGTIDDLVATGEENQPQLAEPVGIEQVASVGGGIDVSVVDVRQAQTTPVAPDDIAGPALVVTVSVSNTTDEPVDLDSAFVTLLGADGVVGLASPDEPADPLSGVLPAGEATEGVYVFATPAVTSEDLTVYVSPTAGVQIAHFVGQWG